MFGQLLNGMLELSSHMRRINIALWNSHSSTPLSRWGKSKKSHSFVLLLLSVNSRAPCPPTHISPFPPNHLLSLDRIPHLHHKPPFPLVLITRLTARMKNTTNVCAGTKLNLTDHHLLGGSACFWFLQLSPWVGFLSILVDVEWARSHKWSMPVGKLGS